MLKRLALLCALVCALPALAQVNTTVMSSNAVFNSGGAVSGTLCMLQTLAGDVTVIPNETPVCGAIATGTVASFPIANPITSSTAGLLYRMTVLNAAGSTLLTVPNISLGGNVFDISNYALPSNATSFGVGQPTISCLSGAQYRQDDATPPNSSWGCVGPPYSFGTWQMGGVNPAVDLCPPGTINAGRRGGVLGCFAPMYNYQCPTGQVNNSWDGNGIPHCGFPTFMPNTSTFQAAVSNGVYNPTVAAGADIGAKINTVLSANCSASVPCTIKIPDGIYTDSTTVTLPSSTFTGTEIIMSNGAQINYTGSGYFIVTPGGCYNCKISGGIITGTAAGKGGIAISLGTQQVTVEHTTVQGFSTGDGILVAGANTVTLLDDTLQNNKVGLHLIGAPGFAANAVRAISNRIILNTRWGIVNGDISNYPGLGVSSAAFNNTFIGNDLEGNGNAAPGYTSPSADCTTPSGCGAILDTLAVDTVMIGNYFENSPTYIILGALNFLDSNYSRLYNVTGANNGTSVGAYIHGNFFNGSGSQDVVLQFSIGADIEGNSDGTVKATGVCSTNTLNGSSNPWIGHNSWSGNLCLNNVPGVTSDTNQVGVLNSTGPIKAWSTSGCNNSGIVSIGVGLATVINTCTAPVGSCGGVALALYPAGMSVCQSGIWTAK